MAYSLKLAPLAVASAAIVVLLVVVTPCGAVGVVEQIKSAQTDAFVYLHNAARADVGVRPVSWNLSLAAYAQSYAALRQDDCLLQYSGGPYGENLFWGAAGVDWTVADVVGLWVGEKVYYDYGTNTCAAGHYCGAYTQVVWNRTTTIGCGAVECSHGAGIFVICSYNPPGNLDGQRPY